jgi:hypothetical protein
MALLATLSRKQVGARELLFEVVAGVALGIAIPWVVLKIDTAPIFAIAERYDRLLTLARGAGAPVRRRICANRYSGYPRW